MTRAFVHFVRKILYRRRGPVATIAAMALLATWAFAQEDRPQIFPGERKPVHQQDLGPRALAVLQLGANGRSSLVPIAILINGKFWDASVYKADPVPMALDSGTVYDVERSGSSQGLFTVNGALHRTVVNAPNPWIATGSWVPNGTVVAKTTHKAEITPVGLETNDEPPRLTRGSSETDNSKSATAPKPTATPETTSKQPQSQPSSTTPSAPPASSPASNSPQTGSAGAKQSGSAKTGSDQPQGPKPSTSPAGGKPTDTEPSESQPAAAAKTNQPSLPASDSGASEENRPKLRRGRPTEPLPGDDEVEGYSKPGAAGSSPVSSASLSKENKANPDLPNMQLIPAISDAAGPEPHSYTFDWIKGEEQDRQKQMTIMAKDQLRAYLKAQAKATITPEPEHAARKRTKPEEPVLDNVKMTAYDLWTSNQPVIVFSAEAHMPPSSANAPSNDQSGLQYSILLVAYPDIYNNLHKLYAGVTDKYHLDVTPRLELVDAVDADGDGFGELLFRETSDAGTGWVIYRATADKLWKMFDSLNPE
jgi:hypothetical protein